MRDRHKQWLRLVLGVCGVAGALAATRFLPVADVLRDLQEKAGRGGAQTTGLYAMMFAVCNILLLPGGILTIGAGAIFGVWRGFLIVLLGNTVGAMIAFAIGRTIGRPLVKRIIARNTRTRTLRPAIEREGWKIILLSQLHPLFPTSLLVYLYALTKVRFGSCMLLVAVGRAPGLLLYSYLGALGSKGLTASARTEVDYVTWIAGGLATIGLLVVLSKMTRRLLAASPEVPGKLGHSAI